MTEQTLSIPKWLYDGQGWITLVLVDVAMYEENDYQAIRPVIEDYAERKFATTDGVSAGWKLEHGNITFEAIPPNYYARLKSTIRKKEAQA